MNNLSLPSELQANWIETTRMLASTDTLYKKPTAFWNILGYMQSGLEKSIEEWDYEGEDHYQWILDDLEEGKYSRMIWHLSYRTLLNIDEFENDRENYDFNKELGHSIPDSELKELLIKLWELEFWSTSKWGVKFLIKEFIRNSEVSFHSTDEIIKILSMTDDKTVLDQIETYLRGMKHMWIDEDTDKDDLKMIYLLCVLDKELDQKVYWWNQIHSIEERRGMDTIKSEINN